MIVVVGEKFEGNVCRVLIFVELVDEFKYVEFFVFLAEILLKLGFFKWVNYVKGVVVNYIGMV